MPQARIGLALAGGGPLGAIYEVGALCALEEAIEGLDLSACEGYIGVSAGGFIAAALVNGMTPRQLCAAFIENSAAPPDHFDPAALLEPAWAEFGQRLGQLPGQLTEAALDLLGGRSWLGTLERLGRLLPNGLLSSERFGAALQRVFAEPGRSNDFRQLRRPLILVATDLDTGEAIPFGAPGWDHVPISRAVQASAALPGLYPPIEIDGRCFVDGALKKTLHASMLLDQGLDLLLCINPLVPYASDRRSEGADTRGLRRLTRSQDRRSSHQATRAQLRSRAATLAPQLARAGLRLRRDVLANPEARLLPEPQERRLDTALRELRGALSVLEARYSV